MPHDVRVYLYEIRKACEHLEAFIEGKSISDYPLDVMLRSAVERQFEIIGEALTQMLRRFPEYEERITEAYSIIGFRNRLIHEYRAVDHEMVWGTIVNDVPILKREVDDLLQELGDE